MTILLYRGDSISTNTFKTKPDDPIHVYGPGVYTTMNPGFDQSYQAPEACKPQYVYQERAFYDAVRYQKTFNSLQIALHIGGRLDRDRIIDYVRDEVKTRYLDYQRGLDALFVEKVAEKNFHQWWNEITKKHPVKIDYVMRGEIVYKVRAAFTPVAKVRVRHKQFRLSRFEFSDREFHAGRFLAVEDPLPPRFLEVLQKEGYFEGYEHMTYNLSIRAILRDIPMSLAKRLRFFRLMKEHVGYEYMGIRYLGGVGHEQGTHRCFIFWDSTKLAQYQKA